MLAELLLTVVAYKQPQQKRDNYVVVSETKSASTVIDVGKYREKFFGVGHLVTYNSTPKIDDGEIFVSSIKKSLNVISPIIVGGKISQPSIDEDDDLVMFDE